MKFWSCIIRAKEARLRWRAKYAAASRRSPACTRDCAPWPRSPLPPSALDPAVPDDGPPYATHEDLRDVQRLDSRQPDPLRQHGGAIEAFSWTAPARCGSPAPWSDKPAAVFTSTQTLHGGQESTLAVDDAAAAPSRHVPGRPAVHAKRACPTRAAAERPMARATWRRRAATANLSDTERDLAHALGARVRALASRLLQRSA